MSSLQRDELKAYLTSVRKGLISLNEIDDENNRSAIYNMMLNTVLHCTSACEKPFERINLLVCGKQTSIMMRLVEYILGKDNYIPQRKRSTVFQARALKLNNDTWILLNVIIVKTSELSKKYIDWCDFVIIQLSLNHEEYWEETETAYNKLINSVMNEGILLVACYKSDTPPNPDWDSQKSFNCENILINLNSMYSLNCLVTSIFWHINKSYKSSFKYSRGSVKITRQRSSRTTTSKEEKPKNKPVKKSVVFGQNDNSFDDAFKSFIHSDVVFSGIVHKIGKGKLKNGRRKVTLVLSKNGQLSYFKYKDSVSIEKAKAIELLFCSVKPFEKPVVNKRSKKIEHNQANTSSSIFNKTAENANSSYTQKQFRKSSDAILEYQSYNDSNEYKPKELYSSRNSSKSKKDNENKAHLASTSSKGSSENIDHLFKVTSKDNVTWIFEVPSSELQKSWIKAIENLIVELMMNNNEDKNNNETVVDTKTRKEKVNLIKEVKGNDKCADCGSLNPMWVSLNLGILICIQCCGVHRYMGVKISLVRSLELDDWSKPCLEIMKNIGNSFANTIWNPKPDSKEYSEIIKPNCTSEQRTEWIKRKYQNKEFLKRSTKLVDIIEDVFSSIENLNIKKLYFSLISLPNESMLNSYNNAEGYLPLHYSIKKNNSIFFQMLIWAGVDHQILDGNQHLPIDYVEDNLKRFKHDSVPKNIDKEEAIENMEFIRSILQKCVS